jgi:outer membrane protein TolC
MAQANATIGIARAAYFPNLTLSATGGFESSAFTKWLSWSSRFWSVGTSLSETIFDAGLRRATVQQFVATYNADLAGYRQTVLTAFQQVEDDLAEVRILSKEIQQQQQAVNSAQTFLKLEQGRYETGIDPYVNVLIAQNTLLSNQQTLNNIEVQEMTAAVALIEALGGGWDRSQLPSPQQVTTKPARADTSIQQ